MASRHDPQCIRLFMTRIPLRHGNPARHFRPVALLVTAAVLLVPAHASAQSLVTDGGDAGTTDAASATGSPPNPLGATVLRMGLRQDVPLRSDGTDADDLNTLIEGAQNLPEPAIDGDSAGRTADDGTGIRLGSFMLRPTINESINGERTRSGGSETRRTYAATAVNGTLSSDWSRHALTVTAEGTHERNLSGNASTKPEGRIDADLRLDLADQTVAHLTGGYAFQRESTSDPNAVSGATTQAGVNRYSTGASLSRDFGILRGTASLAAVRSTYGSARFADGSRLSLGDRDRWAVEGRLRLGYELSPALIPFIEASLGRAIYDDARDSSGYARSSHSYGGRGGLQFDFGEKLRGEFGIGYATVDYEDARLASLGAVTLDGTLFWSPHRGTDVDIGLRTTLQDSTTAGVSGWREYQWTAGLSQQVLTRLTARLTGSVTQRNFSASPDETDWQTGFGLIWNLNRYFDLTANLGYEHTGNASGPASNLVRAGIGVSLRR